MSIYLVISWPSWDSLAMLFIYNHLYRTEYFFQKESKYIVVIKKEKNTMSNKGEIYIYNNMSRKSV